MRIPLALFLTALLALAPAHAMAAGVTYGTYRNQANGYTIDYPAEWTILSKETLKSWMDSFTGGEKIEGLDASVLEAYKARIEAMDTVMFMSSDGAVNASIHCQPVPRKLASDELASAMYPAVLEQYQSMFADYAALSEPRLEKVGSYEFARTAGQYTLSGETCIMLQAFYCTDNRLYAITFTINGCSLNPDLNALDAIFCAMLSSFRTDWRGFLPMK